MTTLDNLLGYSLDGKEPALGPEFEGRLRESRRFKAFVVTHRVKVLAKLKTVRDANGMSDLRAELEAAALLLRDDRFTLEYEKYAASRPRGPDFTVTFKTRTPFNVEVRRIRGAELDEGDVDARMGRLMAAVCDKIGQIPPGSVNLLWLRAEADLTEADVSRAMVTLRQLAERKTEEYFTRRGFTGATHFLRHFGRLSGIVLRRPGEIVVTPNLLARHKAPPEVMAAIQRLDGA